MINRRKMLKWSVPTIAAVSLPAHAEMSMCMPSDELFVASRPQTESECNQAEGMIWNSELCFCESIHFPSAS